MTRPDAAPVGRPVPVLGDAYTINLGPLFVGRVERSEARRPRAWAARWTFGANHVFRVAECGRPPNAVLQPKAGDASRRSWLCRSASAPRQQAREPVQDRCSGPCSRPRHAAAWRSRNRAPTGWVAVEATSRPRQFGYETPQLPLEGTVPKPGKFGFSSLTLGSVLPGSS